MDSSSRHDQNKCSLSDSSTASSNSLGLNREEVRLSTFKNWPRQSPVSVERLARAGFFYSSNGTEVTCFSCGGKISQWDFGDSVIEKHKRFYPKCEFVKNGHNNVPFYPSLNADHSNPSRTDANLSVQVVQNGLSSRSYTNGYPVQVGGSFLPDQGAREITQEIPISSRNGIRPGVNGVKYRVIYNPQSSDCKMNPIPDMKIEAERLKTFRDRWPLPFIDTIDMVKAGFYYLQINDKVKCAFCEGVLTNWERGDFPMSEHARNFPLCPFVLGREVGNVPIPNLWDIPATSRGNATGGDVCGRYNWEVTYSQPENKQKVLKESKQDEVLKNLGIARHEGPQHPSQASRDARLRSFQSWPLSDTIKPEELAEAGFFYIGISDHTKCFYCDGGLCNWELGDDPWVEHAKWFCNCTFVLLNKGEAFVKACLESISTASEPEPSSSANNESHPSAVPPVVSAIHRKVDDVMKSNMVQAFIQTDVFPVYLIRQAILWLVRETGDGPKDFNDLSEAIDTIRHQEFQSEVSSGSSASANFNSPSLSPPSSGGEDQEELNIKSAFNIKETNGLIEPLSSVSFSPKKELCNSGGSSNSLEEENRLLKEQRMCKICMDQEVGVVFLPCGHLIACPQCAPALKDCALCRTPIKGTIRTFLS